MMSWKKLQCYHNISSLYLTPRFEYQLSHQYYKLYIIGKHV
jgi:hypothetical protein